MITNPTAIAFASPEYNAFKNNDYQTGTITISGTILASASGSFTTTIPLQRQNSVTQLYFVTNRTTSPSLYTANQTYILPPKVDYADGTTPGFPLTSPYTVQFFTAFTPTQVTVTAYIGNPYAATLSNIDATYTIYAFTFIAPFVV